MIEAYAFLAMFAVQILTMSVLYPAWLAKVVRAKATEFPAERFAQQYPGIDQDRVRERYLKRYRAANAVIAVLGLVLMRGLFNYLQRADWDDGPVEALAGVYFLVQASPLLLAALLSVRYGRLLESLLENKRKASLQRRGLFDFVSPFTVFLAVLSYFLFAAYVLYIARNPFPGFAGPLINVGLMTLVYASQAFGVYWLLYRKRPEPLESTASRVHTMGVGVRGCVYMCIACAVNLSINFTLVRLDMQRWEPFAQSAFFVFAAFLAFMAIITPPRRPEIDAHGAVLRATETRIVRRSHL
jgi:hypothetical protein